MFIIHEYQVDGTEILYLASRVDYSPASEAEGATIVIFGEGGHSIEVTSGEVLVLTSRGDQISNYPLGQSRPELSVVA